MTATPQPFSRLAVKLLAAPLLGAALFMPPAPAQAAGETPCSAVPTRIACQNRTDCSWKNNSCKNKTNRSEITPYQQVYIQGRLLAKTGEFAKAIQVLKTADQSDPHVLNYLGYSYRKSGDLKTAIGYYKAALAIDPDFVLAREYLGEGYVKAGRLDLARLELEQIGERCGKGCKEYVELAAVIAGTDTATW